MVKGNPKKSTGVNHLKLEGVVTILSESVHNSEWESKPKKNNRQNETIQLLQTVQSLVETTICGESTSSFSQVKSCTCGSGNRLCEQRSSWMEGGGGRTRIPS